MDRVLILDTTLRDGEQTPFVSFTLKEKRAIAKKLDELGVDIIEAGIPAMGKTEMDCVSAILGLNTRAQILAWNRMHTGDIEKSMECGAKNVHIAVPVSDLHIRKKLNQTREWVLQTVRKTVEYAVSKGLSVSVGAEDASRADEKFLIKFYRAAIRAGAVRVRYADTVGLHEPFSAYDAIKRLKRHIRAPIDYHGHNDFGMSTANAFAACRAGAEVVSCTVNGLGERAGNTPLEEFVMALKHIAGSRVAVRTQKLQEVSRLVEECSRRRVYEGKAIVGSQVYFHESGIHVDGLLKDKRTYQAFPPEDAGAADRFVLGKFSGASALEYFLRQKGLKSGKESREAFLKSLREACRTAKPAVPEQMMEEYFKLHP
jgi:homocitrate synthase NifV